MEWFRLYTNFYGDPRIQSLSFDDQRHLVVLWCMKADGTLDRIDARTRDRIVARGLGLDQRAAGEARVRLVEVGLIGDDCQPLEWEHRQNKSDSSAARVRKYRKNKESCNVTVTLPVTLHDRYTQESSGNSAQPDKTKANQAETIARQAFNYWCLVMGKGQRTVLDAKRKAAIQARLREGYTLEDIRLAIDGCKLTPHNMGQNDNGAKYNDIELICRSAANLERFRDKADTQEVRQKRSDVI